MSDFLRSEPGERIDHPDFQHAAETSQLAITQELIEQVFSGEDLEGQLGLRVISGFTLTGEGSAIASVSRGRALLGYRKDGVARFAQVTPGGDLVKNINIATFDPGTDYGLFVRFTLTDGRPANRVFWDSALVTPAETVRNIATRRVADWEVAVERIAAAPGEEWLRIATFDIAGGVFVNVVANRLFMFEGREDAATPFLLEDADWGTANDRSTSYVGRIAYGVRSFSRFVMAMLRQMQDVIGDRWFTDPKSGSSTMPTPGTFVTAGPRSLKQLNEEKLAQNGDMPFTGTLGDVLGGALRPATDNASDLGAVGKLWQNVRAYNVRAALAAYAPHFLSDTAGGATPVANALYKSNVIKACGRVVNTGGGTGNQTLTEAHNVTNVNFWSDGGKARWDIGLPTPMANTNYLVIVTSMMPTTFGAGVRCVLFYTPLDELLTGQATVRAIDTATNAEVLFVSADVAGYGFSFVILGDQ